MYRPHTFFSLALLTLTSLLTSPTYAHASGYLAGLKQYWGGYLAQQSGVVMTALIVAAASIFIVTRGRWKK